MEQKTFLNFCTLFDKNFLLKGLALHDSLSEHCPVFKLFILSLDDLTYDILKRMGLSNVVLLKLEELDDQELLNLKNKRKASEFAWTCKPPLVIHILKKYREVEYLTYFDSDIYLYSSPSVIYEEIKDRSIIITPHRFPENKKHLEKKSGIYNAGNIIFRNDNNAMECLEAWRKQCLDWCYDYMDNGRLGDQMYLDKWSEKYKNVYVLNRKGANLGSWNISNYRVKKLGNKIYVDDEPLFWYHFHSLKLYEGIGKKIKTPPVFLINKDIYKPYLENLSLLAKEIKKLYSGFNFGIDNKPPMIKIMKQWLEKKRSSFFKTGK